MRQNTDQPILNKTRVRRLRRLVPFGTLLEVGCGEGFFLKYSERFFKTLGVDISAFALTHAKMRAPQSSLARANALHLPFKNESVDAAAYFDVVEHVADPHALFSEIGRVLKKGGVLIFSTPNPQSLGARVKGRGSFIFADSSHISVMTIQEWRNVVESHNLTILRDGTDFLWDVPYLPVVPRALQWVVCVGLTQLLFAVDILFPWHFGENYICLARKTS